MLERFRKKTVVQVVKEEPKHVMPNHDHIVELGYEAKQYIEAFLKDLSRTQLMDFQDAKQFDGTKAEDAAWEATNNREWELDWPMGAHEYKERIPDIVSNTIAPYKLTDLSKKVDGMQKKLDRIVTLLSNAKFELCGEDALKL